MVSEKKSLLKEQHIPGLIVWVPILSILITALLITGMIFVGYRELIRLEVENLRDRLLLQGKDQLMEEIDEVFSFVDYSRKRNRQLIEEDLRSAVYSAISTAEKIYTGLDNVHDTGFIASLLSDSLQDIAICQGNGSILVEPLSSGGNFFLSFGKTGKGEEDRDNEIRAETIRDLGEKGEGFLLADPGNTDTGEDRSVLYFLKVFKPLDLLIGAGYSGYSSERNLKMEVIKRLNEYRFGNNNYLFIYDNEGNLLMHPYRDVPVAENVSTLVDSSGKNFGKQYMKASESEEGVFVTYKFNDPSSGVELDKIGFARQYPDWEWNIGTGIYFQYLDDIIQTNKDNLENSLRAVLFRLVGAVLLIICTVFILTIFFARFTASLFGDYKIHLQQAADKLKVLNQSLEWKVQEKTRELEKSNRELEELSVKDGLSGIFNRRYFDSVLEKEWYRHKRNSGTLALIMCDIDFFKQYNDTYGHQKGDDCIRLVGRIMGKACRRPTDVPVRYGGEEFAVILPRTDISGALEVAREIQTLLAEAGVEHISSSVGNNVTISIGIAIMIPSSDLEVRSLIECADIALYRAKTNGRNRIESSDTCN